MHIPLLDGTGKRTRLTIVALILLAALVTSITGIESIRRSYELVSVRLLPDPARAFSYGERHFDAEIPGAYDIDAASYFFETAASMNPDYPYLAHERARIAFLKGDFATAMTLINEQIGLMGDSAPSSYYIRALIEGYMGDYAASAKDYEHFLLFDPNDWAALNDYSWALLKGGRFKDAASVTSYALRRYPSNPWLLNSNAIALYEIGDFKTALSAAQRAVAAGEQMTEADWLHAYPGNDPKIAAQGVAAFRKASLDNMHSIESRAATGAVQSL